MTDRSVAVAPLLSKEELVTASSACAGLRVHVLALLFVGRLHHLPSGLGGQGPHGGKANVRPARAKSSPVTSGRGDALPNQRQSTEGGVCSLWGGSDPPGGSAPLLTLRLSGRMVVIPKLKLC